MTEKPKEALPRLFAKIDPESRDHLASQFAAAKEAEKKAGDYMFALIQSAERAKLDAWNAVALTLGFKSQGDAREKGYSLRVNYGSLIVEAFEQDDLEVGAKE